MTTCDKVRSNGEVCGKPCADGQKKNRCAKHKGLDPVKVDPDANPYTPNSREWLDFNKKLKKAHLLFLDLLNVSDKEKLRYVIMPLKLLFGRVYLVSIILMMFDHF